jgi:hypothetical protein
MSCHFTLHRKFIMFSITLSLFLRDILSKNLVFQRHIVLLYTLFSGATKTAYFVLNNLYSYILVSYNIES